LHLKRRNFGTWCGHLHKKRLQWAKGVEGAQVVNPTPFNLRDHQDKAIAILVMSIKDELFPCIANVDDPNEVWNILKNLYDAHNSTP
jgi:hypothetical protein